MGDESGRGSYYPRQAGATKRILLMDDEEIILTVGRHMLESLGYRVDIANNGEEAVGKYVSAVQAGEPFDAVILDLTVRGGMGGREAMKRICETDPGARAIVSSGYLEDPGMEGYDACGFKASLAKPYELEELERTLSRVIGSEE